MVVLLHSGIPWAAQAPDKFLHSLMNLGGQGSEWDCRVCALELVVRLVYTLYLKEKQADLIIM